MFTLERRRCKKFSPGLHVVKMDFYSEKLNKNVVVAFQCLYISSALFKKILSANLANSAFNL